MNKLLLVDADGLVFHSSRETLEESIQVLNDKIQNMYEKTEATHAIFFISQGKYFRHSIDPNYKKSRGNTKNVLKWLQTLKMYLKEAYNAQSMSLVEADDLVAYWSNPEWRNSPVGNVPLDCIEDAIILGNAEIIICTPDKDLLQSIKGKHFNYSYRLVDKTNPESVEKGWWIETSEAEADAFNRMQIIVGDTADGVLGLKGKGIKYWERLSSETIPSWGEILQLYCVEYGASQGVFEFQKNYRLLHMLTTDEDFLQEVGELPIFPVINTIKPEEIIEYS